MKSYKTMRRMAPAEGATGGCHSFGYRVANTATHAWLGAAAAMRRAGSNAPKLRHQHGDFRTALDDGGGLSQIGA